MFDRLPFPHITATKPEDQIAQLKDYLIQFKEDLEFILAEISEKASQNNEGKNQ